MTKQQAFINAIAPGAVSGWHKYQVLPSVTMAQAIIESGWGESRLTRECNNLFGIKANSGWTGETGSYNTREWVNGQYINTVAAFRKYPSLAASMEDHGEFLNRLQRYAAVIGERDYWKACKALQAAGYATSPTYAETLVNMIRLYELDRYDLNLDEEPEAPPASGLHHFGCVVSAGDLARFEQLAADLQLKYTWKGSWNNEY